MRTFHEHRQVEIAMPARPDQMPRDELELAVEQAIAACDGDVPASPIPFTVNASTASSI